MDYLNNYIKLKSIFNQSESRISVDEDMEILNLPFNSESYWPRIMDELKTNREEQLSLGVPDSDFFENNHFIYSVFVPEKKKQYNKAILLLHGLNERHWDKYLPWAYYLAKKTHRPVILFPIAFHMNRAPLAWNDAKALAHLIPERKKKYETQLLSFANIALSIRLSDDPLRFLKSGQQTAEDVILLVNQMKQGLIPLFEKDTQTDIFAYSIGGFVSQIMFLAFPEKFFSDTKLFLFCGGAFFNEMNGVSKLIMDQAAFENIRDYYIKRIYYNIQTNKLLYSLLTEFPLGKAFYAMLKEDNNKQWREKSLQKVMKQIYTVSLKKDMVIPAFGTEKVLKFGSIPLSRHETLDFPYEYTHETPFPVTGKVDPQLVNDAFNKIFSRAGEFLA